MTEIRTITGPSKATTGKKLVGFALVLFLLSLANNSNNGN